jgi:hypothetical protein
MKNIAGFTVPKSFPKFMRRKPLVVTARQAVGKSIVLFDLNATAGETSPGNLSRYGAVNLLD